MDELEENLEKVWAQHDLAKAAAAAAKAAEAKAAVAKAAAADLPAEVVVKKDNDNAPTTDYPPAVAHSSNSHDGRVGKAVPTTEAGSIAKRLRFGTPASKELALYDRYLGIVPIGGGQQKKVIFLNAGGGYPHFARLAGEYFVGDVDASKLVSQSGFPLCLQSKARNTALASKKQVDSSFPDLVVACKVDGGLPRCTLAVGDVCTMVDKKTESALLMAFDVQCDHLLLVVAIADVLLGTSRIDKTQRRAFACLTRLLPRSSVDDTVSVPSRPPMLAWVKASSMWGGASPGGSDGNRDSVGSSVWDNVDLGSDRMVDTRSDIASSQVS
eukprot:jgi/Mesvir1/15706/Mv03287-RA.1